MFIIVGSFMLLFLFFGDVFLGLLEGILFFNLILVFLFFICFLVGGYIGEFVLFLLSLLIVFLFCIFLIMLVVLFYIFVLVLLLFVEELLVYREDDFRGRFGKVIIVVLVDGFGEVVIEGIGGIILKLVVSFDN